MQTNTGAVKGNLSAKSMIKAKSIAASILNMSENDLADMLDTDQVKQGNNWYRFELWDLYFSISIIVLQLHKMLCNPKHANGGVD